MMIADPRLVKIRFYYSDKIILLTINDYDIDSVDNGIIRISIEIEDIKQINITEFNKIFVIINGPFNTSIESESIRAAKSITVFTSYNNIVVKRTFMLAEISEYNIGDEIIEELDPNDIDMSQWKEHS